MRRINSTQSIPATPSYRSTFRRHRLLFSVPVILAVLIAGIIEFSAGKSYMSTASLWVDSPATTDSSLGNLNPAVIPPAQAEQGVVTELLATRDFALAVGHNSLLAPYLRRHPSGGLFSSGGSLNDQLVAALGGGQVVTTVAGPQVLQVSFDGPTPKVAANTLSVLIGQLGSDSTRFSQQHLEGALAYYKGQVQAASQALQAAQAQVNAYTRQHPNAGLSDPSLGALTSAEGVASTQLSQATSSYNAAASTLRSGAGSEVQTIDRPTLPTGPTTSHKKELLAILAGLFAGALISFLGVVALTPPKPRAEDRGATLRLTAPTAVAGANGHVRNGHDTMPRLQLAGGAVLLESPREPGDGSSLSDAESS